MLGSHLQTHQSDMLKISSGKQSCLVLSVPVDVCMCCLIGAYHILWACFCYVLIYFFDTNFLTVIFFSISALFGIFSPKTIRSPVCLFLCFYSLVCECGCRGYTAGVSCCLREHVCGIHCWPAWEFTHS